MAINLKQILTSDTDNIKLDKVNYNFDQLVANGGGPQGNQGAIGDTGYIGVKGDQGFQGDQGFKGDQGNTGNSGLDLWKTNEGSASNSTIDTLVPIHDVSASAPLPNPPSVVIGYRSDEPQYDDVEVDAQLVINRNNNFNSNLELGVGTSLESYRFTMDYNAVDDVVTLTKSFTGGSNNIVNEIADEFIWSDSSNDLVTLDINGLDVSVDSKLNKVTVDGSLKISTGNPGTDKIAVSTNAQGSVAFKSISELGGIIPVGTIISMNPATFNNNSNFTNAETFPAVTTPIEITVGRGVGSYAGWYLCNGKTWTDGANNYIAPDLNSYSYTIDEDIVGTGATRQGGRITTNTDTHLVGGSDSSLVATFNTNTAEYTITGNTTSGEATLNSASGGTTYIIKRLPQIIYFGASDLYWQDAGTITGSTGSSTQTN